MRVFVFFMLIKSSDSTINQQVSNTSKPRQRHCGSALASNRGLHGDRDVLLSLSWCFWATGVRQGHTDCPSSLGAHLQNNPEQSVSLLLSISKLMYFYLVREAFGKMERERERMEAETVFPLTVEILKGRGFTCVHHRRNNRV